MADERGLEGLDPYSLQDGESARIADWVASLDDEALAVPSECEGWSRRDVMAHLLATEDYHAACLGGTVTELMKEIMATGASNLDEINAWGVAQHVDRPIGDVLADWEEKNAASRAGFRAADGTDIDSSIGSYPGRLQAFHVAYELAIHANDMHAPVSDDERDHRQNWLAAVSRFALTEIKEDVTVEESDGGFVVKQGENEATFDRDTFVVGVSGRTGDASLTESEASLLSLGY